MAILRGYFLVRSETLRSEHSCSVPKLLIVGALAFGTPFFDIPFASTMFKYQILHQHENSSFQRPDNISVHFSFWHNKTKIHFIICFVENCVFKLKFYFFCNRNTSHYCYFLLGLLKDLWESWDLCVGLAKLQGYEVK